MRIKHRQGIVDYLGTGISVRRRNPRGNHTFCKVDLLNKLMRTSVGHVGSQLKGSAEQDIDTCYAEYGQDVIEGELNGFSGVGVGCLEGLSLKEGVGLEDEDEYFKQQIKEFIGGEESCFLVDPLLLLFQFQDSDGSHADKQDGCEDTCTGEVLAGCVATRILLQKGREGLICFDHDQVDIDKDHQRQGQFQLNERLKVKLGHLSILKRSLCNFVSVTMSIHAYSTSASSMQLFETLAILNDLELTDQLRLD